MPEISKRIFIWVPRDYSLFGYSIVVDGVTVTSDVFGCVYTQAANIETGTFQISLNNFLGAYSNRYKGGEVVQIYADFSDTTTKVFEGKISKSKSVDQDGLLTMNIEGYDYGGDLLDLTVTESYISQTVTSIISDLVSKYLTGYTTTNASGITDTTTVSWNHASFWQALKDLADISNCNFYIDANKDIHFFKIGSIENFDEAAVWSGNILDISGLLEEQAKVKNRIIIYGEDNAGLPIIYTANNAASQLSYGVKEFIVSDPKIGNMADAATFGDSYLSKYSTVKLQGTVKTLLIPQTKPGDLLWIAARPHGIHNLYSIVKAKHDVWNVTSEVTVTDDMGLAKIFRQQIEKDISMTAIDNPNKMTQSYNFTFDDNSNIANFGSTQILNGSLILASGTSGTMITSNKSSSSNIISAEIRMVGQSLGSSSIEVSNNGGQTYTTATERTAITFNSVGSVLKARVTLVADSTNPNPALDSISFLYKV